MSSFLKALGFQQQGSRQYNPTSGTSIYTDQSGQRMFDAPWMKSPQVFNGNFARQAGLKPPQQTTEKQQATSATPNTPAQQAAPAPAPSRPVNVQSQLDLERERLELQRQQREADARRYSQQRDQDYQRNLQSQLDTIGSRLGGYTINDLAAINSAQRQIDLLNNQASSYRSDTANGVALSGANSYQQALSDLLSKRQAEQDRFDSFSRGINTNLSNYGDYTVNSDLNAAEKSLRDMLLSAQNYDTALNVDLNSPMSRIQFAMDDIGRLGQERTRQQGVIDAARQQAEDNLAAFGGAYTDVDYRNAQALSNLSGQLDDVVNPDLDVDLAYDFSDLTSQVDPYRDIVADMQARRMRDLDDIGTDIGQIGDVLGGFQTEDGGLRDVQSASEVYDVRDRLGGALDTLTPYGIGNRTTELRGQIFDQDEIYGQLADQLRGRQGQIETDAQAQLDALAEARLTRPDDIRSFEQALQDLTGQRDLFDASVAADELQRLTDQIASRRSDLERDEAARIARQELERKRAMQVAGNNRFNNRYMTADDYSAYLRALELGRKDDYYENVGTSFSRALGLA